MQPRGRRPQETPYRARCRSLANSGVLHRCHDDGLLSELQLIKRGVSTGSVKGMPRGGGGYPACGGVKFVRSYTYRRALACKSL